jgi:NAD+ synthase
MESDVLTIISWLNKSLSRTSCAGFVVGVSGGIDSALTSTLCAMTKKPVTVVSMPINQDVTQLSRASNHMDWLCQNFPNVQNTTRDLTPVFESFAEVSRGSSDLAMANAASRLRMVMLYSIANTGNLVVVGTGNKVEDYGIGFFTKYGDGGVDISPIADLLKSEVRTMARHLGVSSDILFATPTDGLWGDNRSDESQIGASYEELEWALDYYDDHKNKTGGLSLRQKEVLLIYTERHLKNRHKLQTVPICNLKER